MSNLTGLLFKEIQKRGVSVSRFAIQAGIPTERVYQWKKGNGNPKHEDAEKIRAWLGGSEVVTEKIPTGGQDLKDVVKTYDALFSVLVAEVAALRASVSGEHSEVIVKKIYKAAEDVAKLVE